MAKVQGLADLNRKLNAMPKAARVEVRKVLDKSADEMVALARSLVAVDEGDLLNTIEKADGKHEMAVVVRAGGEATTVNGYDHSISVEHGTTHSEEQPFFWPSYRAIKKRAKGRATRAIRKAVRAVIGGG